MLVIDVVIVAVLSRTGVMGAGLTGSGLFFYPAIFRFRIVVMMRDYAVQQQCQYGN